MSLLRKSVEHGWEETKGSRNSRFNEWSNEGPTREDLMGWQKPENKQTCAVLKAKGP